MHTCNAISVLDFRDPTKYLYNSDLVEFTEYAVQLKDLLDPSIVFGAKYNQLTSANYANEGISIDPITTGTVTIENNRAALIGGQFYKQLSYAITGQTSTIIPAATVKFVYFPNYSGNPDSTQKIFRFTSNTELTNCIEIQHSSVGDFVFRVYDKNSLLAVDDKLTYPIENANEGIEILFTYKFVPVEESDDNSTKMNLAFYVNGTKFKSYELAANSFNLDAINNIVIGSNEDKLYPNFSISQLLISNTFSDLSDTYTTGYEMVDSRYSTSPCRVQPLETITVEQLNDVQVIVNDQEPNWYVRYTFELDDVEYFFDRQDLTWKEKTEFDQVSELSYMLEYKDYLNMTGKYLRVIPYLVSIAGNNSPSITSMTISFNPYVCCKEITPTALVYGYVKDVSGEPVRNAKILVTPSKSSVASSGNYILPKLTQKIRTGVNGYWDIPLALSSTFDPAITYNIEIYVRDELVYSKANIEITKEGTIAFDEL